METVEVATPVGTGRLVVDEAAAPIAILVLGHGAGGGIEAFDLSALAEALPPLSISVARFEQPWHTAGRRVAGAAAGLDTAWRAALQVVTDRWPGLPLVVGGRSAGARVACRCFAPPARAVVALAFPLHPPGRPASSRAAEAAGVDGPLLVVQGERDPFGSAAEVRTALVRTARPGREIVEIPGAVHALGPTRKADDPHARARLITTPVARFVTALVGPVPEASAPEASETDRMDPEDRAADRTAADRTSPDGLRTDPESPRGRS